MASTALRRWKTTRASRLNQIRSAHTAVREFGVGRRAIAQQINYAYALLLAAEFQGFCRDLHSEAMDFVVAAVRPASLQVVVQELMSQSRMLDKGNASPASLGADFGRFEMTLWELMAHVDRGMHQRQSELSELNAWRNAIAHHDFRRLGRMNLRLDEIRSFHAACRAIAQGLDVVVGAHLTALVGATPGSIMENVKAPRPVKSKANLVVKVGDRVALRFGSGSVSALVVHDYGDLGVGGRRILRVRLLSVDWESEFDVHPERILAVTARARRPLKKTRVRARARSRARTARRR